ncbi:MAG TPA: methyltransferase domain-containing protein [Burkholderiales bacterium]|nr:methyltransferase domain-containing protein [Burkholderiales bacterium]
MRLLAALALAAAACAASANEFETKPPFITTPQEVVEHMLRMAGAGPGDLVIDLGSGDGRIPIAAAEKFGARGLGIELDAALVSKSQAAAKAAGVQDRVQLVQGDVLVTDISRATVVTVYLLPGLMGKLQSRFIAELQPGTRIVSHEFTMAGWLPDRSEIVKLSAPHRGQGELSRLHLWIVPADVRGTWRGAGGQVRIEQSYNRIEVEGARNASITGREVRWDGFKGRVEGNRIVGELAGRPVELERR